MDRFPLGSGRGRIDRNPAVISGVRLVKSLVERGCVVAGRLRHLLDRDVGAGGRMLVLQVKSLALALIGHFPLRRQI